MKTQSFINFHALARTLLVTTTTAIAGLVMVTAGVYLYLNPQIPTAASYRDLQLQTPLRIYAADGSFIAEYGERRRIPVPIDEVPTLFIQAVLDTEDKRFYTHSGIDFVTLFRSTMLLLRNPDQIPPGGSTITMQLARNISFSLEQTFLRKFKEMLLAVKIERELSKDEILELYLNVIPFGHRAYGAEAAALTYYGKTLSELNVAQLAMIAGIPQAPSITNPVSGPERALRRRAVILRNMYDQGHIDTRTYERALAAPITASLHQRRRDLEAPWVAEWARRQTLERYGQAAYDDSFEVFTSIQPTHQAAATAALRAGLTAYDRRHGYRGPQRVLRPPDGEEGFDSATLERWQRTVAQTPVHGPEIPALVLATHEEGFEALLASGARIEVPLAGMRWARPYLTVNSRGARPSDPGTVVQPGHLIRVNATEDGGWRLGQLPEVQGALVGLRPQDGAVRAMVGGFDFRHSQFNHAMQAARQPGSAFKPFLYSAAIAAGETPASIFDDAPMVFQDANLEALYRPRNDSGRFSGPTRLRPALFRSINLVSMRLLMKIGAGNAIDHAANFGFDTATFPRNLQLSLGGGTMAVTPLDMARAYAVFANGGYLVEPWLIERIEQNGEVVYRHEPRLACEGSACERLAALEGIADGNGLGRIQDSRAAGFGDASGTLTDAFAAREPVRAPRVLDERTAYIMHSLLGDVINFGTGRRARSLNRGDLGGKTGTTNEADTWFAGYQHDLSAVAWVGFSDNRPLGTNEFGSNTALPIWIDFMETALRGTAEFSWDQPPGIVRVRIDPATGRPASIDQPDAIFEIFKSETAPTGSTTPLAEDEATPESIF